MSVRKTDTTQPDPAPPSLCQVRVTKSNHSVVTACLIS